MLRSLFAVFGGYLAMSLLVMVLFMTRGAFWPESFVDPVVAPPLAALATTLLFSLVAAIVGGFVTATIAAHSEPKHVLGLMGFMVLMWLVSIPQAEGQPAWYRFALLPLGPLGAWLGGRLGLAKKAAIDSE